MAQVEGFREDSGRGRFDSVDCHMTIVEFKPTLFPTSVAANTTANQALTVTGVKTTDTIIAIIKPPFQAGLSVGPGNPNASPDAVNFIFENHTAAAIVPTASEIYKVYAARFVPS